MEYVLVIQEVNDFPHWKPGFDEASDLRKKAGELEYQVLVFDGEPNRVVHYSKWKNHKLAKLFFESDRVSEIRKKLGVKEPKFIYLNQIESGML